MRIIFVRNTGLFGDALVASIFGSLFVTFAALTTLEDDGSLALFLSALCTFVCGIVFICAVVALLIALYSLRGRPGPGRGIPLEKQTTPCDARS